MQINVKDIKYNRFRDLNLNPINADHVDVLADSITELGFFSGITVRPLSGGKYEAAAGHHRFEAARQAGIKMLEAVVQDYSDEQMVAIMVKENATQRGGNALATLDSVAATARIIAKHVLLGEGDAFGITKASGSNVLGNAQTAIAKDGPGIPLLYRAINGFDWEKRKEAKSHGKAETMSKTDIEVALSQLKESGYMAGLISQVYAEVESIRAEQRKAEEAERAKKDAEEKRQREAAEKADREAKEAAERAAETKRKSEEAAKLAKQRKDKEAEDKAKAAAEKAERDRLASIEAEKQRKLRQAEADKAATERRKRDAADAERQERERKEKLEVERQQRENRVYDLTAGQVFMRPSHQQAFRTHVTSQRGLIHIPKSQQLALAKRIKAEMESLEKNDGGSVEMGSSYIKTRVMEVIIEAEDAQRKENDKEAQLRLLSSSRARVDERWERIRRAMQTIEAEMMGLDKDLKEWQWGRETFPMNRAVIRVIDGVCNRFKALAEKMGLN